jgi:transcription initiation factor TFIID subunit 2
MCFVDDLVADTSEMLSMSLCSNRLLFSADIIDTLETVTRQLGNSLACQWMGINLIPQEMKDTWVVVGVSGFMTDLLMKKLCGNNDYRFRQKIQAAKVSEADVDQPSLANLGSLIHLDQQEMDFMALKAPVVLFILDRRLAKSTGLSGLIRVISRIFLNAKAGDLTNGTISTAYFIRWCERLSHVKLDIFFNQWISNAGCPRFSILQRFNKKKMVLEMTVRQEQVQTYKERPLDPETFMRDVKEDEANVYAGHVQMAFLVSLVSGTIQI